MLDGGQTSTILSLVPVSLFIVALVDAERKPEVQKLEEEIQKAAEKHATISFLTAQNEALKKPAEHLKAQSSKKKGFSFF